MDLQQKAVLAKLGTLLTLGQAMHGLRREMTQHGIKGKLTALRLAVGTLTASLSEIHLAIMDQARIGRGLAVETLARTTIEGRLRLESIHGGGEEEAIAFIATAVLKRRQLIKAIGLTGTEDSLARGVLNLLEDQVQLMEHTFSEQELKQASKRMRALSAPSGSADALYQAEFSDSVHLGGYAMERFVAEHDDSILFEIKSDYPRSARALSVANVNYLRALFILEEVFDYGFGEQLESLAHTLDKALATSSP